MCASRTYFIIMVCFMLLLVADKVKRIWIIPTVFFVVMLIALIPSDLFRATSSETFMSKLLGSFNELKMGDYNTEQDINMKYRGYESFMALKGYMEGDTQDWIFGGLGKTVDLRTFVRLGEDTDFQFIPVLHNGWLYLLVKMGIAGVLVYIIVFFSLIITRWKKYADTKAKPAVRLFAALSIGCIFSLLLTNYIVTALFNVEMCIIMITLGYSYLNFRALVFKQQAFEQKQAQEHELAY
jgi:O-antigen ligase